MDERFEYDGIVIELSPMNDSICIYVDNRSVGDVMVCLPDDAFRDFAAKVKKINYHFTVAPGSKMERFRNWLRKEIGKGRVPGVSECKDWLGHQNHTNPPHGRSLGHPYTRVRIAEFYRVGYKKHPTSGRWYRP